MRAKQAAGKRDDFCREERKNVPQGLKALRLNRLPKNPGPGRKDVPQGLKPGSLLSFYGPTKVVP